MKGSGTSKAFVPLKCMDHTEPVLAVSIMSIPASDTSLGFNIGLNFGESSAAISKPTSVIPAYGIVLWKGKIYF